MYDDVIKFSVRRQDLDRTDEFWQGDTFDVRWKSIMDNIVSTTGFSPSKNMEPIREGVFQVSASTTVDDLRGLSVHIAKMYGIDCFQIAIDRSTGTAHLLFDFNIRGHAKSVVINRSQQIALSVLILRYLDLPRPAGAELWLGYFLKDKFNDDPEAFSSLLRKMKHARLGKKSYALARDMILYVQQMCKGQVK